MNPKPLPSLNHFTLPSGIACILLSQNSLQSDFHHDRKKKATHTLKKHGGHPLHCKMS